MSDSKILNPADFVAVKVSKLLPIIKSLYDDNLSDAVMQRYGEEILLLTKEQAVRWHSFVDTEVDETAPPSNNVTRSRRAANTGRLVGPRLKSTMGTTRGVDTPNCTRYRG